MTLQHFCRIEQPSGRTEIIRYFQLRLRSLPIVRLGGSVRIVAESGTLLFLPVASYGMQEKRDFVFVTALLISVESRVLIMIFN